MFELTEEERKKGKAFPKKRTFTISHEFNKMRIKQKLKEKLNAPLQSLTNLNKTNG